MKMKWSSSSSSLSSAGDRRSSTFYTEHDTVSNTDEMTSNAFTSLESTILVPTIKSATLPSNPDKYLEFTKNTSKMTVNNSGSSSINSYKLKNITNKINNRQNKLNNNNINNNKVCDDQLSDVLKNLLYFEFRLKNEQKVIHQMLYEKDEIINRQWRKILCIKAKYKDEDIENIPIDDISQYCPRCRKNYYGIDANKSGTVQTSGDEFGYRERKISPSQSVEFASSSEEPEFNHQQHAKPNSFTGLRRNKKYISKKTTGTFTDYLKRRHHSYSPSPNNTPSISNSDDQIEIKSILSHGADVESSYSQRINSLHGIKVVSPTMTRSSGSSTTYERIESRERKQNNKFIYDFEEKNDNKAGFEVTDDWYASASDVEDSDNGMIKPYGYNAVNPVLECVNQILLQQSMDGIIENGAASPSPPPSNLPPETPSEIPKKPPTLPMSLPPISHTGSQQKHQTLPRTKRVHFSTQNSMVQVPRNKTTAPPPPPPPPPSSSNQSHNSNSSEKSMKNSSYDVQSIYSNEYEPIGGGSENTSVSSNYYIDMDSTTSMSKPNSITNSECNRNLADGPMSKMKLNPPDLPPKPPNLIKVKKLTKFNLNLNQNLVNTNGAGGHNNPVAMNQNPNNSGGNSNVNGSVSEPDYCSISEIHEIIVNNSQTTGGSSSTSSKVNGLQHNIQTVEAEVHKACDEYSISNHDDDSISVKSIIKLDDYNKNLLITSNGGGGEQIQIQQTNDNSNDRRHDRDDDSDDLNDIPKLPNVAEIITPTKKEAARNLNNILSHSSSNSNSSSNFMSINQDNYITKSIGELKFTNGSSAKLNGVVNNATNKKLNSIMVKSPTSNNNNSNNNSSISNKVSHQHAVIHDNNSISIIPSDKIPLIQAEFDWYNLDAEYGKSVQSGGQNAIPDVLTNNSANTNHGVAQNSGLSFLKLFDNCNIEPTNNHVEYNLDDIEFNNNSTNSATHSSASSTHSSSDSNSIGPINTPDIIKKIQEFENLNGKTANLLKFNTNYERFLSERAAAGKPVILPRRKRVYYSGPFV